MSDMAETAAWQHPQVVAEFLDRRQALLPLLDVQEDLVRRLFERHAHRPATFLDIGAGDGAMSQLIRSVVANAEAVLVDFSEPMLARVEARLGPPEGCWRTLHRDLSQEGWSDGLTPGSFGAAVSSFAIHHLPSERKRGLFAELFELLEPGGMFVNMDVVTIEGPLAGLFDEQIAANAAAAAGHEHADVLPDDGTEDRPDAALSQLAWLREAGFADVELHFKWAEGAIFGAVKPENPGDNQWTP
jgi:tRNA (cmo5U34)-methyltransferase